MEVEDTVILLGDSPFLSEISDTLYYVLDKFTSVGINRAVSKFNVTYQVFVDERMIPLANSYCDISAISLSRHGELIKTKEKELYDSYSFNLKSNTAEELLKDGKLAWCGFTHDFALSYLITKGWKNIVLVGAADMNMGASHYSVNMAFLPNDKLIKKSKKFIEEFCAKRANIFTCNPNSVLSVPRINLEELLA